MEKLVLIDGNSLINRAFYAMPLLTTKEGVFTNAVYGFMNMFFKMVAEERPTKVAVAFDVHAPTFRHKLYNAYKGTRKPMPEELRSQIPLLKEVLKTMNVYTIEKAGLEADDLIGTIAKKSQLPTLIYTGDKDALQLVDDKIKVCFTRRGLTETEIFSERNFKEKTGIDPIQIIDLKALMGDSSDNIMGVAGIGEKTATTLVQTYGSVDNLYTHTAELTGKIKEKIEEGKESAYLSYTLATINVDSDIEFSLDDMNFKMPLSVGVKEKFIELEFKSLYTRADLFEMPTVFDREDFAEKSGTKKYNIVKVKTLSTAECPFDKAEKLTIAIEKNKIGVFDGETEYDFTVKEMLIDDGFELSAVLKFLSPCFSGNKKLIVYDKKGLRHLLKDIGVELVAPCEDVSIIKYLADYTGKSGTLTEMLLEYNKDTNYLAVNLFEIYEVLVGRLEKENMTALYSEIELPLADVLFCMEETGFKVDYKALDETAKKYRVFLEETEREIKKLAEEPTLNINSPKQLGEILFIKLKVGKGKKTKSGYSTSAEVLESLEDSHPIIPLILKYRRIQKLQSTYVEGFKPLIDRDTGLIRTSFNQTVTSTGRLSSKEPNLQNIPVRDDEGKELRKFFVPRSAERVLISADYSQIELRLLAAFSDCKPLINAFLQGKDIHRETAAKVFNVPIEMVTEDMRRSAKAVNFGIIYGISEYGLAKNINTTSQQAKEYIASYFNQYPEVMQYMKNNVEFAKKNGYSITMLGRRRYIKEIYSSNYNLRQFGERAAMNMPLQGSAADIIKVAMIRVFDRLKKENMQSQLILQIHDELIIDAFKSEQQEVVKILEEEMSGAANLSVPLTVSVGIGETWYDAK